jgi:hypothetical protein
LIDALLASHGRLAGQVRCPGGVPGHVTGASSKEKATTDFFIAPRRRFVMRDFFSELSFTLQQFLGAAAALAPRVVAALVILALGVLVATLVRRFALVLLRRSRFDVTSHRLGLAGLLARGGAEMAPSEVVASMLYWLVLAGSILQGLSALDLPSVDRFVGGTVSFLTRLVVACLVAAGGYVVSLFFGRAALIAAANAHMRPARWIAAGVQGFIVLFAAALALEQLGIAPGVVRDAFSILFGGVVLALALAFGIGGQTVAREILEQHWRHDHPDRDRERDELRHL